MAIYHRVNPLESDFQPPRPGTWSPRNESAVPIGPQPALMAAASRINPADRFGGPVTERKAK